MHFQRHLRRVVFGATRAAVKLAKKLHLKLRRTCGEPQLGSFFKLLYNSPICGRVARGRAIGGSNGRQDIMVLIYVMLLATRVAEAPRVYMHFRRRLRRGPRGASSSSRATFVEYPRGSRGVAAIHKGFFHHATTTKTKLSTIQHGESCAARKHSHQIISKSPFRSGACQGLGAEEKWRILIGLTASQ